MTRSFTVHPGQSMTDVLTGLRIAQGDEVVVDIPPDASVLLTANEFRALSLAAEREQVAISVYTEDPLRRQLAMLFGVPLVNEIPEPEPYQPEAFEPEVAVNGATAEIAEGAPAEAVPDAIEEETAPAEEEAPVRPRRPVRRSFKKAAAAVAALVAVTLAGLGGYWWFFSTATVAIDLRNEPVSSTLTYSVVDPGVSTDGLEGIVITGQPVTFELSLSLSAPATGKTTLPDQAASGTIVLRNPQATPVTIKAGAEFESFQGTRYVFEEAVEVPAATDGGERPGEATAVIRSAEPGAAGNTELGMLTGRLPNGVYYSNRMEPVSGGTEQTITTVSEEDLTALRDQANQQLTALAATTELQDGLLLVPSSIVIGEGTYEFDQAAGDEAEEVTVSARVPFVATAYDPSALSDVAAPGLASLTPAGYIFDLESVQVNTPAEAGRSNGVVSMIASISGDAVPIVDDAQREAIAGEIAGSSESEAEAYLNDLPFADGFTITYSPSWLPGRIPDSAERVSVDTT